MSDGLVVRGEGGSISVTPSALAQIVQQAAETVDGVRVRRRRGLDLQVDESRARVGLELAVQYGTVLPDLARDVQERVADALTTMAGLDVEAVDVSVEELEGA